MTSYIRYQFRSAKTPSSVQFEGAFIGVVELKRLIADKTGLPHEELVLYQKVSDGSIKDYEDHDTLPRASLVLVKRVPVGQQHKRALVGATAAPGAAQASAAPASQSASLPQPAPAAQEPAQPEGDEFGADPIQLATAKLAAQEQLARQTLATQQRVDAAAKAGMGRGGPPGQQGFGGRGTKQRPPPLYMCPRCNAQGIHWLDQCPTQGDSSYDVKRVHQPRGLPKGRVALDPEGDYMLPNGQLGQITTNTEGYRALMGLMQGTAVQPAGQQLLAIEAGPSAAPGTPPPASPQPQQAADAQQPSRLSQPPPSPLRQASPAPTLQQPPASPLPDQPQQPALTAPPTSTQPAASQPAAATPPGLFDDDDDALQAAAQQVKLDAGVKPSALQPPAPTSPETALKAKIDAERARLPADLKRSIFSSAKDFTDNMELLMSYNLLPNAPKLSLVRAYAAAPLTPTEWQMLQEELQGGVSKGDSEVTARREAKQHSGHRSSRDGGDREQRGRGRDRERDSHRRGRSRSRSQSPAPRPADNNKVKTTSATVVSTRSHPSQGAAPGDKSHSEGGDQQVSASASPAHSSRDSDLVKAASQANGGSVAVPSGVGSAPVSSEDEGGSARTKRRRSESRDSRKKHKKDKDKKKSKKRKSKDKGRDGDGKKSRSHRSREPSEEEDEDRKRRHRRSHSSDSDSGSDRSRSRDRRSPSPAPRLRPSSRGQVRNVSPVKQPSAPSAADRPPRPKRLLEGGSGRLLSSALTSSLGLAARKSLRPHAGRMGRDSDDGSGGEDGKWHHDKYEHRDRDHERSRKSDRKRSQ